MLSEKCMYSCNSYSLIVQHSAGFVKYFLGNGRWGEVPGGGHLVAQLRLPEVVWRVTAGSFPVARWYPGGGFYRQDLVAAIHVGRCRLAFRTPAR